MNLSLKIKKIRGLNLTHIFAWLCVVCSSFVLETSFVISPVHIIAVLVIGFLLIRDFYKRSITFNKIIIATAIATFYFGITQILLINLDQSLQYLNGLFKMIYVIITILTLNKLKQSTIIKYADHLIIFSIILFTLELIVRLFLSFQSNVDFSNPLSIYIFKENCIMYDNTCMLGFQVVSLFFLTFYLNTIKPKPFYNIALIALFTLTFFTFSRASISIVVVFWLLFKHYNFLFNIKSLLSFIVFLMVLILGKDLYIEYLFAGSSFDSKMAVFPAINNYIHNSSIGTLLVGEGILNVPIVFSETGDTFLSRYFVGSGLVGVITLLAFYAYFVVKTKLKAAYVILPMLAHGIFLYSASTLFYCSLALIYVIEKTKKQNFSK